MSTPGDSSRTNLRGATITGAAIATGTNSQAFVVRAPADAGLARIADLIAELRGQLAKIDDPALAGQVAQTEGTVAAIEREVDADEPQRSRLTSLLQALSAGSDLVTLSAPIGALVAAVTQHFL